MLRLFSGKRCWNVCRYWLPQELCSLFLWVSRSIPYNLSFEAILYISLTESVAAVVNHLKAESTIIMISWVIQAFWLVPDYDIFICSNTGTSIVASTAWFFARGLVSPPTTPQNMFTRVITKRRRCTSSLNVDASRKGVGKVIMSWYPSD